jgi:membrane associated rhomboid family serine protease
LNSKLLAVVAPPPYVIGSIPVVRVTQSREPIFNVPAVVIATIGMFCIVHAVRTWFFTDDVDLEFILLFAFIPIRYDESLLIAGTLPGGWAANVWTFVTYAFLHADVMHLGFNSVWFLAFGTPMARRFGSRRFLAFFAATSAAGAAAHLLTHTGEIQPMIGASAAVSGAMAGAFRFMFQPGGPLRGWGPAGNDNHVPAISLSDMVRDARIVTVIAVWFGVNLLFGLGSVPITGAEQPVAWQAHVGGFLAGLLLFGAFDPVAARPQTDSPTEL